MNHLKLKIGDMFRIKGRICRKTSVIGFIYIDEAYLGEVQFDFLLDSRIEVIDMSPAPASPIPEASVEAAALAESTLAEPQLPPLEASAPAEPDIPPSPPTPVKRAARKKAPPKKSVVKSKKKTHR